MKKNYDDLGITDDVYKGRGRYPKSIKSMIKLDIYARVNHKSDAKEIVDLNKHHDVYRFVSDNIQVSVSKFCEFRKKIRALLQTFTPNDNKRSCR